MPKIFDPKYKPQKLADLLVKNDSKVKPRDAKELVEGQDQKNASQAFSNSKDAAINILPTVTISGIKGMMEPPSGGIGGNIANGLGFFIAVSGLILDPIKAPIAAVISAEEALRGSILKVKSLVTEGSNPEQKHIQHIYHSFLDKMNTTANLLIDSGLETKENLLNKIQSHEIGELIGLTILYSAYHSRYYDGVLLSNDYTLIRANCPEFYLPLYDQFMMLKDLIKSALKIPFWANDINPSALKRDAISASQWISYIKEGKLLIPAENNQFSPEEINLVNKVIHQIATLREAAKLALPESEEDVTAKLKM